MTNPLSQLRPVVESLKTTDVAAKNALLEAMTILDGTESVATEESDDALYRIYATLKAGTDFELRQDEPRSNMFTLKVGKDTLEGLYLKSIPGMDKRWLIFRLVPQGDYKYSLYVPIQFRNVENLLVDGFCHDNTISSNVDVDLE